MIRLDDPDAAERLARIWNGSFYSLSEAPPMANGRAVDAMQAVLDAIEVPRLPTRSEVVDLFGSEAFVRRGGPDIATALIVEGWAVEDPEPEVDPAQVEALAKLMCAMPVVCEDHIEDAKKALASGRVKIR